VAIQKAAPLLPPCNSTIIGVTIFSLYHSPLYLFASLKTDCRNSKKIHARSLTTSYLEQSLGITLQYTMKIFLAAEDTGAIKEVVFDEGMDTSVQDGPQPLITSFAALGKLKHIQKLALVTTSKGTKYIAAARKNGTIEVYPYLLTEESTPIFVYSAEGAEKCPWIGLTQYDDNTVVAGLEDGRLFFLDVSKVTIESDKPYDAPTASVKGPLACFALDRELYPGKIAVGGKERDLEVFGWAVKGDEVTVRSEFQARNVKSNEIDMRVPVWISGILFQASDKDGFRVITATRHGQIRVYETWHGKRPKWDFKVTKDPLRTLAPGMDASNVVSSDAHSSTFKFNFADNEKIVLKNKDNNQNKEHNRKSPCVVEKFPGSLGAVLHLVTTDNGLLATVGLDRYLRIFDLETTECTAKMFVGTQVSSLLFVDTERKTAQEKHVEETAEKEDDELWNDLDKVEKKSNKRRVAGNDEGKKKLKSA
jgi:ribosome biogenesis protein NSA1